MERIEDQEITFPEELKSIARDLDRLHTASRYPDVLPEIYPQKAYDRIIALRVKSQAQKIIDFCNGIIEDRSNGEKMSNSKKLHRKETLLELFRDFLSEIQKRVKLHAFIVFGSQARGNALEHSDYDILIVADFTEPYLYRGEWLVKYTPNVAIDLFTYTPAEFDKKFHSYNLTAIDSIGEGIPLYGETFYTQYLEKYQYFVEKGMRKDYYFQVLEPPSL